MPPSAGLERRNILYKWVVGMSFRTDMAEPVPGKPPVRPKSSSNARGIWSIMLGIPMIILDCFYFANPVSCFIFYMGIEFVYFFIGGIITGIVGLGKDMKKMAAIAGIIIHVTGQVIYCAISLLTTPWTLVACVG
jgi:hypothetical protein